MDDCLFCRIVRKELPADILYEDDKVLAFKDINPVAPHHLLIIPKEHIPSINEATPEHEETLGRMFTVAAKITRELGIDQQGYRAVVNTGKAAGQVVFHMHMHVVGGRKLTWPPG